MPLFFLKNETFSIYCSNRQINNFISEQKNGPGGGEFGTKIGSGGGVFGAIIGPGVGNSEQNWCTGVEISTLPGGAERIEPSIRAHRLVGGAMGPKGQGGAVAEDF